jgi:hypothetical protein
MCWIIMQDNQMTTKFLLMFNLKHKFNCALRDFCCISILITYQQYVISVLNNLLTSKNNHTPRLTSLYEMESPCLSCFSVALAAESRRILEVSSTWLEF